ncbi:alpha/beta hydrolase [Stutzerimonas stutzeri]|uniref:Alpha/beta hydrolase n=1 Tax=Stutzerimonas stutzeri TaxID=316 RepID=W8RAH3_STUST|nr:alpha/beta hydrolase [Stutzerimonas stutzeri]AHL75417.1 alpha/beta hydrolase [Stutzerimonas stutzeri]MCQ4328021.1 alpha/beta hydrolase [Stutzerimonas stutzeri]
MNVSIEDRYLPTEHGEVFTRRWRTRHTRKTPIVLLHDSLGCVELWRDFPERLAAATARDVIAYDRLGFGRSMPHPGGWSNHYIRDEAERLFPQVWQALDIEYFIAFGHSAGGIMATSLASRYPRHCRALIAESALAFVEDRTLQGIRQARAAFAEPGQLERLRKYHGDKAQWILSAWIDTWLSDSYAGWTIADSARDFACPLLAIHGLEDEYGSIAHPQRIAALGKGPTHQLLLENCQHVPHREHPKAVLEAVERFLKSVDA